MQPDLSLKIRPPYWFHKPIPEEERPESPEPNYQVDLANTEGNRVVPDISKPLLLGGPPSQAPQELITCQWLRIESEREYNIRQMPTDIASIPVGNLNHLSGVDKVHLFNAVNLWIRNIVIRKHIEDLQLRIESYQIKLNLTQPSWDASYFLFKEDYTIIHKPRAVIYRDRNNKKKMMRESEVHKFSDGTLTRILEKLDHMVKDFMLFKFNPGTKNIIWSRDDKMRSKEFIEVVERRLKIRRIFRSLESFVSRRLRDVDYRFI
ncbi:hypothetical protein Tco_1273946 [Tanacetum coccineum]